MAHSTKDPHRPGRHRIVPDEKSADGRIEACVILDHSRTLLWKAAPKALGELLIEMFDAKPKDIPKWTFQAAWRQRGRQHATHLEKAFLQGGAGEGAGGKHNPMHTIRPNLDLGDDEEDEGGEGGVEGHGGTALASPARGGRGLGRRAAVGKDMLFGDAPIRHKSAPSAADASTQPKKSATIAQGALESRREDAQEWSQLCFEVTKCRDKEAQSVQITGIKFRYRGNELNLRHAEASNPDGKSPFIQGPQNVLDETDKTKWQDFNKKPLVVRLAAPAAVDEFCFITANDNDGRDPVQWVVKGTIDGKVWIPIHEQDVDFSTPLKRKMSSGWVTLQTYSPKEITRVLQAAGDGPIDMIGGRATGFMSPSEPGSPTSPRSPSMMFSTKSGKKSEHQHQGKFASVQKIKSKFSDEEEAEGRREPHGKEKEPGHAKDKEKEKSSADTDTAEVGVRFEERQSDERVQGDQEGCAQRILSSNIFQMILGCVIALNSLSIGLEIDLELRNMEDSGVYAMVGASEHFFLFLYIFELTLHFCAEGRRCLKNPWVRFDFFLVVMGVMGTWVIFPIIGALGASNPGVQKALGQLMILRTLRLVRLIRALRLFRAFSTLWKLAQGLLNSAPTMFAAMMLILLCIYVFACVGAEMISKPLLLNPAQADDYPVVQELIASSFQTLPDFMMMLIQFTTQDAISDIYMPLVQFRPTYVFYFVPLLMVVSIMLMNLVLAAIVEDVISRANADMEAREAHLAQKAKEFRPTVMKIFEKMDSDESGVLSCDQLIEGVEQMGKSMPEAIKDTLHPTKVRTIFEFIDVDNDGNLNLDELVDGLCRFADEGIPVETKQMMQLMRTNKKQLQNVQVSLAEMSREIHGVVVVSGVTEEDKDDFDI